ncbi:zinc finger CW-type PWWP domain protein 1 [Esox lucius]|uniref:zinc finger CW-type PWWP domain protein 1 n=1 Tax=Esox lucius TaxID=8010 RepID=UPI001476DC3A|nr:zinc finger CW-type PWWP domain protein 1 [Esox lucius]
MDTVAGQKVKLKFALPVPLKKKSGLEEKEEDKKRKEERYKKNGNTHVRERKAWGFSVQDTGGERGVVSKSCESVMKGGERGVLSKACGSVMKGGERGVLSKACGSAKKGEGERGVLSKACGSVKKGEGERGVLSKACGSVKKGEGERGVPSKACGSVKKGEGERGVPSKACGSVKKGEGERGVLSKACGSVKKGEGERGVPSKGEGQINKKLTYRKSEAVKAVFKGSLKQKENEGTNVKKRKLKSKVNQHNKESDSGKERLTINMKIENGENEKVRKERKEMKKKRVRNQTDSMKVLSLTDSQYDDIFESASALYTPGDSSLVDQWVQCSLSVCGKWRRVQRHVDLAVLPEDWTCSHSTGPGLCEAVEESWSEKEGDIINSSLFPGSLVWAQQSGYPWWPAMIERDPDTRTFCQLNLKKDQNSCRYHVTYLGNPVSRAWVCRSKVREYSALTEDAVTTGKSFQSFRKKLKEAIQMATQAQRVPLKKRLSRFGFWTRRASDRESSESEFAEVMGILLDDKKRKKSNNIRYKKPFKRLHQQSDGEQREPRKKTTREEKRDKKTEGRELKETMRGLKRSGVEEGVKKGREGEDRKRFSGLKPISKTPSAPNLHIPDQTVPEREEEEEVEKEGVVVSVKNKREKEATQREERNKLKEKMSHFLDEDMEIMGCREELMKRLAQENMEEEDDFSVMLFEEE